jgi:hypothetical protein
MRNPTLTPEGGLESKIERLKEPSPYRKEYASVEAQGLAQAIDIIIALRREAVASGNKVIWNKLLHATEHLEKLLRDHLAADKT